MSTSAAPTPSTTRLSPLGYMPQLDGLRGVAVSLVIVHHVTPPVEFGGWIGVHVFFVLSGFLITSLLLREHARTGRVDLVRFYLRRALRLYPPLLTALIVLAPLGTIVSGAVGYVKASGLTASYLMNLYTAFTGAGVQGWGHTWTLALEEQFYLIWPVVFLLALTGARRSPRVATGVLAALAIASVIVGSVPGADPSGVNPLMSAGGLALGCVLALTRSVWSTAARHPLTAPAGMAALVAAVLVGGMDHGAEAGLALGVLAAALLLAALVEGGGRIVRAFSWAPLVWVGAVSYELYLWHYPLLQYLTAITGGTPASVAWIALPVTVVASALSHRFVSVPLNARFKARLTPSADARPGASPAGR
ncbi:acyltransferase [Clavibacter lycopersici]|uniref:Acyltransferase n=2 Tax=Clavibacter lycopersici TaxID=2301718 RepID=A0A399T4U8_9MICO|nr:acyltransferase [Clavibacter lycopersici]RIJ61747.1 acyltransferase [Clavibacter lycopersici]